ncbi:hypothetical protein [Methanoculleus sp.]|uniref:hypothetical protein n=1 Tax=Methanoculleus sp. TaxID=90427 RepID=UPI001BD61383|nr:hypothetical protein [Methanoculleus sp.]
MIQPSAAKPPLVVTREDLDAYEKSVPALKGIGSILLDMGLVTLDESNQASGSAAIGSVAFNRTGRETYGRDRATGAV